MTSTDDLVLRPAAPGDAVAMADLYSSARIAAVPQMPPALHTNAEDRAWVAGRLADGRHEAWLAETDGELVGYALLADTWLDHLFVRPDVVGQGIGSALLDLVKSLRPQGFCLWVFESNSGAQRFYERHGLIVLEHTDGSANEERAPDLRMAWPGEQPLVFLRGLIDEVDDELAGLLARRAALTSAVQQQKPVSGPAGRDPEREREIATRMAEQAPALGVDRVQRIMHAIITESLDAT